MFDKVLVVCIGNICRSPTAEYLLRHRLGARATMIESAGLAALAGNPVDPVAGELLAQHGIDASAHRATMRAKGTDKRGQGGASATIVNTLAADPAGTTRVTAVTDFSITGRLARFGRPGMIEDVSNRLLRDFAACLQSTITADSRPAATGEDITTGKEPPEAAA